METNPATKAGKRSIKKRVSALLLILFCGSALLLWRSDLELVPHHHTSTILVMEDCDRDFRKPPFNDAVIAYAPDGSRSRILTNLNISQTIGGGRSLSVSGDGKFFVICENVGKHLTAYETEGAKKLWSLDGEFTSATVAPDGKVYAVVSAGTIYGQQTLIIDRGRTVKGADTAGFDMALDSKHKALWLVGKNIKKCDLNLNVLLELNPIAWCASSVDVNPDGSIWLAERDHPNVSNSTNRIFKVSAQGKFVQAINLAFSPLCLRVDRADGSLWVTGLQVKRSVSRQVLDWIEARTGRLPVGKKFRDYLAKSGLSFQTWKFDSSGRAICRIPRGGHTLDIDPSDGSLWLAGSRRLYHYSRDGKKLGLCGGVSPEQKYVVVVPGPQRSP